MAAHRHHWYEYAEIALHIAIVLCSLVLLTDQAMFFKAGVFATVLGIGLAVYASVPHRRGSPAPAPAPVPATAPVKGS